jgi:hypothetical protein
MKRPRQSDFAALLASVAVHAVFCVQAIMAAGKAGGMILNDAFLWLFLPHTYLLFFLPPAWPITSPGLGQPPQVDWLRFAGKLAVAFPASAVYGLFLGSAWFLLFGRRSRSKAQ